MSIRERIQDLPFLGIGVSTEYGAYDGATGLDIHALRRSHPQFAALLEIGIETSKGLDEVASEWAKQGLPTTYHFLDLNLDEPEDFDKRWLDEVSRTISLIQPAWICGDLGLWHFGPRERGHMLLLPPILSDEAAQQYALGIVTLREHTGLEVFPENPPGDIYLGDLHLLDFFARVCRYADTGMVLDCAHLAIYQRMQGLQPLDALDDFPIENVIELHVAGGSHHEHDGFAYFRDDHSPHVLDDTWKIFDYMVRHAPHLKAVIFECERNPLQSCLGGFKRISQALLKPMSESPLKPGPTSL